MNRTQNIFSVTTLAVFIIFLAPSQIRRAAPPRGNADVQLTFQVQGAGHEKITQGPDASSNNSSVTNNIKYSYSFTFPFKNVPLSGRFEPIAATGDGSASWSGTHQEADQNSSAGTLRNFASNAQGQLTAELSRSEKRLILVISTVGLEDPPLVSTGQSLTFGVLGHFLPSNLFIAPLPKTEETSTVSVSRTLEFVLPDEILLKPKIVLGDCQPCAQNVSKETANGRIDLTNKASYKIASSVISRH